MTDSVEVIAFERPCGNEYSLYLTNISRRFTEVELQETLTTVFSRYGLIYHIQIFCSPCSNLASERSEIVVDGDPLGQDQLQSNSGWYAFVNYYTKNAASKAKRDLVGRLFLKGQHVKIQYPRRSKPDGFIKSLYIKKCYELANYYLGFNGWSTNLMLMKNCSDGLEETPGVKKVLYTAVVQVLLTKSINKGLHSEGVGSAEKNWQPSDPRSRASATCAAQKIAYQRAVEAAFSKILLVLLPGGRVHVEINTTVEEQLQQDTDLDIKNVLKVSELDEDPAWSDPEDVPECTVDQDAANMQILQELEMDEEM